MRDPPPPLVLRARWAAPTRAPGPLGIVIAAMIGGAAALGWSLAALTSAETPLPGPAAIEQVAAGSGARSTGAPKLAQDDAFPLP